MADKEKRVKITTPEFRGSFVNLVKARAMENDDGTEGEAKFGIMIVLPKDEPETDKFLKKLRALIQAASSEKHGGAGLPENRLKHFPIRDGDDMEQENFHDHWCIRASTKFKPQAVDRKGNDLLGEDELYSGAWYRASISAWGWINKKGGKGVSIGLNSVLKVKDDKRFGGGSNAKDDMAEFIDPDAGDDDEGDDAPPPKKSKGKKPSMLD